MSEYKFLLNWPNDAEIPLGYRLSLTFFLIIPREDWRSLELTLSQWVRGRQWIAIPLGTVGNYLPLPYLAGLVDAQQLTATATCNTTRRDAMRRMRPISTRRVFADGAPVIARRVIKRCLDFFSLRPTFEPRVFLVTESEKIANVWKSETLR